MDPIDLSTTPSNDLPPVRQVMGPDVLGAWKSMLGNTRFSGKGYYAWKVKVDAAIRTCGLADFVESSEVNQVKDQLLADLLVQTLSDEIMPMYRNFIRVGRQLLKQLDAHYNRKDVGSKFAALQNLLDFRVAKGKWEGVEKHIDGVVQRINTLIDTGVTLDSDLMVCILLHSLPAEYHTMVSSITGQGCAITIDEVRIRAIAEEGRLRRTEYETALPVMGKHQSKYVKPGKKPRANGEGVTCFNCGKVGHFQRKCPEKKKSRTEVAAVVTPLTSDVEERPSKRFKEDPMECDLELGEIKSYRSPPKAAVVAEEKVVAKVPAVAEEKKVEKPPKASVNVNSMTSVEAEVLGGLTWAEARAKRPEDWIDWGKEERLEYIFLTYPKYDGLLAPGGREIFKRKLFFAYKREVDAKKAKDQAKMAAKGKRNVVKAKVEAKAMEVKDTKEETVLVTNTVGLENKTSSNYVFVIDSGATAHMVGSPELLSNFSVERSAIQQAEKGRGLESRGRGLFKGVILQNNVGLSLRDVMLVPSMGFNIISVRMLCTKGYQVIFERDTCVVRKNGSEIFRTCKSNGLYKIVVRNTLSTVGEKALAMVSSNSELKLWHDRLGHLNEDEVRRMLPKRKLGAEKLNCISCIEGKMSRSNFKRRDSRSTVKFGLVHSDVCGPFETITIGGYKYFVTFIDDFSGYCVAYLIRHKSEVFGKFKELFEFVKNKYQCTISILRSDNGGEYLSKNFENYLKENGIESQTSTAYTPQQNGVAERMNRTLQDSMRSMLMEAKLSKQYWGYALKCAVFVRNLCQSTSTKRKAPFEMLTGEAPKLEKLHVFGCICYAHIAKELRSKLDPRAIRCIFLGYSEQSSGYIVQNIETAKISVFRDVKFLETEFLSTERKVEQPLKKVEFSDNVIYHEIPARQRAIPEVFQIPRVGRQESTESTSPMDASSSLIDSLATSSPIDSLATSTTGANYSESGPSADTESSDVEAFEDAQSTISEDRASSDYPRNDLIDYRGSRYELQPMEELPIKDINGGPQLSKRRSYYRNDIPETLLIVSGEPECYQEAIESKDSAKWMVAMKEEMQSMYQNQTWDLVEAPEGRKIVDCRWVYKIKQGYDNILPRYKARLCARGFSQVYGLDFDETYAPVVKFTSVRIFLAKAILMKMPIHQMDVVTAFLYAPIDEEIYMRQAPGFVEPGKERLVCRLKKSIYGLKQSPRLWNKVMDDFLKNEKFGVIDADCCIYLKTHKTKTIMVSLYVDDLLIASDCKNLLVNLKASLSKRFKMKDLGIVQVCLGLEFHWLPDGTCILNQQEYIKNVLERFNMKDCKPIGCPIEVGTRLSKEMSPKTKEESREMEKVPYRSAVGSLIYLVTGTRPDLAVATSNVARFCENPGPLHWVAVKRILRYLKGTSDLGLSFQPKNHDLVGYSDADWAGDIDSRRSTTGYLFTIGGVPVSWKSKRQATVALSTAEAEYMALSAATQEVVWLRKFLKNFEIEQSEATVIFEDNQGCIALAKNPVAHERTKHIDIRYHFIREQIEENTIDVKYLPTEEMLADLLTKGMTKERHMKLCGKLHLSKIQKQTSKTQHEGGVLKRNPSHKFPLHKVLLAFEGQDQDLEDWIGSDLNSEFDGQIQVPESKTNFIDQACKLARSPRFGTRVDHRS